MNGSATTASSIGAYGYSLHGVGVQGENESGDNNGVVGISNGTHSGGAFYNSGSGGAIYGQDTSTYGWAGYFDGNINVTGSITAGTKDFLIDDPIDPANKYLYHSVVESPEMKTLYDGMATLDASGEVEVVLPDYFEALNRDFRYQLASIGQFGPVYVAQEIEDNRFKIAGGHPGQRVSWQVTGVRRDAYALAHPLIPEVEKAPADQGKYLHPAEVAGLERSKDTLIGWRDPPVSGRKYHGPAHPNGHAPVCH